MWGIIQSVQISGNLGHRTQSGKWMCFDFSFELTKISHLMRFLLIYYKIDQNPQTTYTIFRMSLKMRYKSTLTCHRFTILCVSCGFDAKLSVLTNIDQFMIFLRICNYGLKSNGLAVYFTKHSSGSWQWLTHMRTSWWTTCPLCPRLRKWLPQRHPQWHLQQLLHRQTGSQRASIS